MKLLVNLLLLVCMLFSVHGKSVIISHCNHPSSYCRNFNTAKDCGKIQQCKLEYWTGPSKDSVACSICKDAVKDIANLMKQTSTKGKIEAAFMKLCSVVPIAQLSTECKEVVSQDFDMLYDEIVVLIENGDLVCGALGLCSTAGTSAEDELIASMVHKLPDLIKDAMKNNNLPMASAAILPMISENINKLTVEQTTQNSCADCQAFVQDIQNAIHNNKKIVNEWRDALKSECDVLGTGLAQACRDEVDRAINLMVGHIMSSEDTMTICRSIRMCGFQSVKVDSKGSCTDCKHFFEDWSSIIKYKTISPDKLCATISFCDGESVEENGYATIVPVALNEQEPTLTGDYCTDCTSFMTDLQGVAKNNKSIIADITDLIKQQCDQLGPELSAVCRTEVSTAIPNLLPQFEALCMKAVDQVVPLLVDAIASNDVNTICTTILMCPASAPAPPSNGDLCTDCTVFFQDWQHIIANNKSTIDQLNSLIAEQCSNLGPDFEKLVNMLNGVITTYCNQIPFFESECTSELTKVADNYIDLIITNCSAFVKEYLPQLWDLISYNDAETICSTLYMCGARSDEDEAAADIFEFEIPAAVAYDQEPALTGDYCTDCTNFMTDLQGVAKNNKSIIADITDLIKQQCDQLGPELSAVCRTEISTAIPNLLPQFEALCMKAVDQVVPLLVDAIASNDVNTICTTILMCPASAPAPPSNGDLCTDCTVFFQDWQHIIANNKSTIDQLNSLIAEQCSNLGPDFEKLVNMLNGVITTYCNQIPFFESECTNELTKVADNYIDLIITNCSAFVKEYLPQLWDLISYNDAETICSTLYMCGARSDEDEAAADIFESEIPAAVAYDQEPALTGDYCTDCTNFMTDLQGVAKNNKSIIADITDLIKQQCDQLGPELSAVCRTEISTAIPNLLPQFEALCMKAVDQVVPLLVDAIASNDVNTICTTILMCPASAPAPPSNGDLCTDCTVFFQDWQHIIANNKSTIDQLNSLIAEQCSNLGPDFEKLVNMLNGVITTYCNQIPFFESECTNELTKVADNYIDLIITNCSAFVKEYLPQLWDLISYNDAETICSTLYMCGARSDEDEGAADIFESEEPTVTGDYCTDCTNFMTDLQGVFKNNKSIISDLTNLAKEQCDQLGLLSSMCKSDIENMEAQLLPQFESACKDAMDQAIPGLADAIVSNDVHTLCTSILMCPAHTYKPRTPFNGNLCTDCTAFVKDWQEIIANNKSVIDQMNSLIAEVCSALGPFKPLLNFVAGIISQKCGGIPFVGEECRETLDKLAAKYINLLESKCSDITKEYIPLLWDLISNNDAESICTTMYMCGSTIEQPQPIQDVLRVNMPVAVSTPEEISVESLSCDICKIVSAELDKMLQDNKTEAAVIEALEKICSIYPADISAECQTFIRVYGKDVVDLIINEVESEDICFKLKLCSAAKVKALRESASTGCELCDLILQELDHLLEENSTEQEIISAVQKICTVLPTQYRSECDGLISEYGNDIVQLLINAVSPEKVCSFIGLCPKKLHFSPEASTECTVCEFIAEKLEQLVKENSTEEEITKVLMQVCRIAPGELEAECDDFIKTNAPAIIELLLSKASPQTLCEDLKFCPSSLHRLDASVGCELCTLVATELDRLLEANSTETEIIAAVEKVCTILPSQYQDECDELISEYGPEIIQLLVNYMSPQTICPMIGLCPKKLHFSPEASTECTVCEFIAEKLEQLVKENSTEEEITKVLMQVCRIAPGELEAECDDFIKTNAPAIIELLLSKASPQTLCEDLKFCPSSLHRLDASVGCELCTLVATELDRLLEANSTETEIIAAVEKVCTILPSQYQDECDELISEYGPEIIQLLVNYMSPQTICPMIGLCPKKKVVGDGTLCEVCKLAIGFLDQELSSNATREEIEAALENLCKKLPQEIQPTCDDIVKQYTPQILDLANNIFDPDYVCQHLKLCTNMKKPLGVNRCTYGPTYWCQNEATAQECNALTHCHRHVWD